MAQKSWQLSRRKMLFGAGASLALPWMQCMTQAASVKESVPPTRFCSMYFGFGVSLPDAKGEHAQWRWFPEQEGANYELNPTLRPLECRRDDVTVLGGLSHPNGRRMGAHDTGDTFLTGAFLNNKYLQNTMSLDQILAEQTREQVRFPSLVLSTDGGVGEPTRSSTLSYDGKGRPIPALNQPGRERIHIRKTTRRNFPNSLIGSRSLLKSQRFEDRAGWNRYSRVHENCRDRRQGLKRVNVFSDSPHAQKT